MQNKSYETQLQINLGFNFTLNFFRISVSGITNNLASSFSTVVCYSLSYHQSKNMPPIVITSSDDFKNKLAEAGCKLVVVDFYADWCGPCRQIAPKFVALSDEFPGAVFLKVNVDDLGEIAATYGVSGIPHFAFIRDGKKVEEFSGANESKLRATITKLLG